MNGEFSPDNLQDLFYSLTKIKKRSLVSLSSLRNCHGIENCI